MATSFAPLLAAIASVAMVCAFLATPWMAWSDDAGASKQVPAELLQWHSGLSGGSDSGFKPEWRNTPSATDSPDLAAYLWMHGAIGQGYLAEEGFYYSFDSDNGLRRARKTARDSAGIQDGNP